MLHRRILVPALLLPLLLLAAPKPASAQFDFGSWIQRATIIANQITQIRNQVRELRSMASQLTELEDQLDHMERAAKGEIDALLAPFSPTSRPNPSGSSATDSPGARTSPEPPARRSVPSATSDAAAARSPDCGGAPRAPRTG